MRNRPTFATSFAVFSEARPDLTQLAGKLLMKMDNSSYVSTPSRPYARSEERVPHLAHPLLPALLPRDLQGDRDVPRQAAQHGQGGAFPPGIEEMNRRLGATDRALAEARHRQRVPKS